MNSNINNIPDFPRIYVYYEKQSNDKLCGLHCVNSLLQYPAFDPVSLAEIAQRLDEMERKLYEEDTESLSIVKPEGNVDDDGNYNIQVLSEALMTVDTEIAPLKQWECEKLLSESMDNVEAFIFNSSTHWFAIRKICNIWFNLNSTNSNPGPQIISDFYLSAFIKGTEELGYTNFLVKNLPPLIDLDSDFYKNLLPHQKLVSLDEIIKNKPKKINMGDSDEQALEKAIELSKKEYEKTMSMSKGKNESNAGKTVNNFYSEGYEDINGMHAPFYQNNYDGIYFINHNKLGIKDYEQNFIEQDELKIAMEMSMNEYIEEIKKTLPVEPEFSSEHVQITFKRHEHIGPAMFNRNFNYSDKIRDLKNYVKIILRTYGDVRLTGFLDNKIYVNDDESLEDAGIKIKETLVVNVIEQ